MPASLPLTFNFEKNIFFFKNYFFRSNHDSVSPLSTKKKNKTKYAFEPCHQCTVLPYTKCWFIFIIYKNVIWLAKGTKQMTCLSSDSGAKRIQQWTRSHIRNGCWGQCLMPSLYTHPRWMRKMRAQICVATDEKWHGVYARICIKEKSEKDRAFVFNR